MTDQAVLEEGEGNGDTDMAAKKTAKKTVKKTVKKTPDAETAITPEAAAQAPGTVAPQAPEGATGVKPPTLSELLGEITFMLAASPAHQLMFLSDLNWLVVPAVRLNQFRLVRKNGGPMAYVSWALVSDEVEERLKAGAKRLKPDEWRSGDNAWIIDLVAPLGNQDQIIEGLKKNVFAGREFKGLVPGADGKPSMKVWGAE